MLPLILLAGVAAALRLLGARGVGPAASWQLAVLYALSVISVITGAAVFTPAREDMALMVPASVPHPQAWVVATGVAQIAAGAGLAVPVVRPIAAGVLAVEVCVKLPANWRATRERLTIRGPLPTRPWMRIPIAVLWLAIIFWVACARPPRPRV